jgi:hypothetical protein
VRRQQVRLYNFTRHFKIRRHPLHPCSMERLSLFCVRSVQPVIWRLHRQRHLIDLSPFTLSFASTAKLTSLAIDFPITQLLAIEAIRMI